MKKSTVEKRRADRQAAAGVAMELAALTGMTTPELAAKWEVVTGEKPRSHNGPNLRKRLAWRIQELALGGLSEAAEAKIAELAPMAEAIWRKGAVRAERPRRGPDPAPVGSQRDPRLPAPGTVITRLHGGVEHRVEVLAAGFLYQGQQHRSLSKIARLIAKTPWNGFTFFQLNKRLERPAEQRGAA